MKCQFRINADAAAPNTHISSGRGNTQLLCHQSHRQQYLPGSGLRAIEWSRIRPTIAEERTHCGPCPFDPPVKLERN